jgi:hypothetical protein
VPPTNPFDLPGNPRSTKKNDRSLYILKTILYLLAGLVLALGLIAGISLIASSANVHNLLLPLQLLGSDVIANLVTPYLKGLLSGLGIVVLIISFVLSLLLFAVGRLLGHIADLEARLTRLEAHAEPSEGEKENQYLE